MFRGIFPVLFKLGAISGFLQVILGLLVDFLCLSDGVLLGAVAVLRL